ncbi:ankyrin repeat domain-containing protein 50-like [Achlya hypogyna]|uniref:Ankyrin repeat domain-containing protein 50-like n=1 Tax=Achlya hypogyna TaxID=1202772 RepID=A0A1V9Y5V1_ACHHY|nr:ankyrin repeat domain-containing protein 50-like [Achlya hypogyna]
MHHAAESGHLPFLEALITVGADVNKSDDNRYTALHLASRSGYLPVVEALIAVGADVNQADCAFGRTPMHSSAEDGHLPVVMALIAAGADINQEDIDGQRPIHLAAKNGHFPVVRALITAGADVNQADNDGQTPMYRAAWNGHRPVVEALIAVGADMNLSDNDGQTPMYMAADDGHLPVVEALIAAGADVNKVSVDGWTVVYLAAANGDLLVVEALIAAGANVNQPNKRGWTPIHAAAKQGNKPVVMALITAGADVNQVNEYGWTPTYLAAKNGHQLVVNALIAAGSDINIQGHTSVGGNENGQPPSSACNKAVVTTDISFLTSQTRELFRATIVGDSTSAEKLLVKGANPNVTNATGNTPLHVAVQCEQPKVLELLLRTIGVDFTARNKAGDTPLVFAIKKSHRRLAQQIYAASTQPSREVLSAAIEIDRMKLLGQGSFGVVYAGIFENQPVAVKTVVNASRVLGLKLEIEAMQKCKSPYLLQLLAVSGQNTPSPQLVLEYMDGGDLRIYLDKKRDGIAVAIEYSALEVAWVIANALADLHRNNLLHRDLKSNNVLLSSIQYIKVADLGTVREYASLMTAAMGAYFWRAPEVLADKGSYDYAADIYSFGVILTELSTLQAPYADLSLTYWAILNGVHNGTLRPTINVTSPAWLRELAAACMAHDPAQRPDVLHIIKRLALERRSETLLSTMMDCLQCMAPHSLIENECPSCGKQTPKPTMKVQRLRRRVAVAKELGVKTALKCGWCDAACGIERSCCSKCSRRFDEGQKLHKLVDIMKNAMVEAFAS